MRTFVFLTIFLLISLVAFPVQAENELHDALREREQAPRFSQHEFTLNGGAYLGDQTHASWAVGANYHYLINNVWGVGAAYLYSPIITDKSSTFGQSLKSDDQHFIDAEVLISNDAAFRAGKSIIDCDFYLTLGAGVVWINEVFEPMGVLGGGLRVYMPWKWMAFRVDVNNYLHYTPGPTGDTFSADLSMVGGVSFLFPIRKPPPVEESGDEEPLPPEDETESKD